MIKKVSVPVTIRFSSIHHKGVFATRDIKKGTRVIEYVGEKVTKKESDRRADVFLNKNKKDKTHGAVYIFELNKRHDIDGNVAYNRARFINHSCNPNCETEIIRGKIWIIAVRDIKKGQEVTYNYGYDWDDYEDHPCVCNEEACIGFMLAEDHWSRLKRVLAKKVGLE